MISRDDTRNARLPKKLQRQAQQGAAAILVTDEAIEGIRHAAQGLETIRGRLNAAATLVSFDMTEDEISGIDVDGEPLTGDRRSVQSVEPVTITVPDRGRITVEPAIKDRDKLLRQRRDAEAALREALEDVGAKSVTDAEDQYTRRQNCCGRRNLPGREPSCTFPRRPTTRPGHRRLPTTLRGCARF